MPVLGSVIGRSIISTPNGMSTIVRIVGPLRGSLRTTSPVSIPLFVPRLVARAFIIAAVIVSIVSVVTVSIVSAIVESVVVPFITSPVVISIAASVGVCDITRGIVLPPLSLMLLWRRCRYRWRSLPVIRLSVGLAVLSVRLLLIIHGEFIALRDCPRVR